MTMAMALHRGYIQSLKRDPAPQVMVDTETQLVHPGLLVPDYCAEEVTRQGHDIRTLDGIQRVSWMMDAWSWAIQAHHDNQHITLADIETLGRKVEVYVNLGGFRTGMVRVGPRICPHPREILGMLERLLESQDTATPLEFYKEFEFIHPFGDGNGRTGKILLNWKNRTLDGTSPVFPPHDLFDGVTIRNP